MVLRKALEKTSNFIVSVKTGTEVVKACLDNPDVDLILMDIKLPGLSGLDATRQIRQFNNDVIVIAQTADGLSVARDIAIEAGCNDYISKPIDIGALMSLIQKYFSNTGNKN